MSNDQHLEDDALPPAGNPAESSNKDVPPAIASFVENFYNISDTPEVHEQYANDFFINDDSRLSFQIGPMQPTNERKGIVAWRQKGWEGVTRRKHVVNGIFISPKWENEIMLDGTVEMDKNRSTVKFNWAGRMVFDQKSLEEGSPKIETYKVWLVSSSRGLVIESMFMTLTVLRSSFQRWPISESRLSLAHTADRCSTTNIRPAQL